MFDADTIIRRVTDRLSQVPGLEGVVLGGSRARGTHAPDSDVDIGIYYDTAALGLDVLGRAAQDLDDAHRPGLVQPPGSWGKWVNGGGWLSVDGCPVDFLLRDIARVEQVIRDTDQGVVAADYQVGHPHAYISAMYRGELAVSRVLHAGSGRFFELKAQAEAYPAPLAESIIGMFLFEAGFSLMLARKNADRDDLSYVAGHCCRSVFCLNQVLFAVNREYCLNEKKAVRMITGFPLRPEGYKERVDLIVSSLSADAAGTGKGLQELERLVNDVTALAGK